MVCLYGCFLGLQSALHAQANLSDIAARKAVSPTGKLKSTAADFLVGVTVQFLAFLVAIGYMWLILKIDLGNQAGRILLAVSQGCQWECLSVVPEGWPEIQKADSAWASVCCFVFSAD